MKFSDCCLCAHMQNALRLATVTIIGDLLLFLAKITVAAGCGLIAFGMSETKFYSSPEEYPETQLSRMERKLGEPAHGRA
eukprot:scaffold101868_cov19-Tisochrysis_lutea.AAC.2